MLLFGVDDRESFTRLEEWLKEIKENADESCMIVIVGNKCDLASRTISYEEAKSFAD